ncbi:hypothetical protein pmac_cds_61 [Pandoravirus macleodensis]|uniref:Uncharacterized protein n=1 Tax=Pandoravirus macleodensis TaxID=2107707 RepID=A0A2U7UE49_9VIRU|nr:hypothetical protein pmac_cds_61 [Pandoravirus macleodensis]AVK76749.1 hypothetical protein pmac_cds_61 [Pandoravirus macleodensis]
MTAFFAADNNTIIEDVTVVVKASQGTDSRSFVVPLDRFTIYRSGFLTDAVIQALRQRDADLKHDEPIRVAYTLPDGIALGDCDHLMTTLGLVPVDDETNVLGAALLSLKRVVQFWKVLVALESRHAVDACATQLRRIVTLDDSTTVLIAYLYGALRARSGACRSRTCDNVMATLFPLNKPTENGHVNDSDAIKYMTLGNRLLDAAMKLNEETIRTDTSQPSDDLFVMLGRMVTQHGTNIRAVAAEALRDWSLALNTVDQVFGSDFSMCKPLSHNDERIRWLMGSASVGIGAFEHTIRKICPAFAKALLNIDGVLEPQSVVMAGGAVVNAIQNPKMQHWLPDSDIDLWIVGEDHVARTAAFGRVADKLFAAAPGCRAKITGSVVTFYPPDGAGAVSAPVQVIFTPYRSASQVVCNFDMTSACAYYDGDDVYATWACAAAIVTRVARSAPGMSPKIDRMLKAIDKGFFLGAAEKARICAHNAQAKDAEADKARTLPGETKTADVTSTTESEPASEKPHVVYLTASTLVKAFCFRPLSSNDYRCSDDSATETVHATPWSMPARVGGRFVVAMPLMDIFFNTSNHGSRHGPEQLPMRLLDTKAVGPIVGAFADAATRDCADARGNVIANALYNSDASAVTDVRITPIVRDQLTRMIGEPKGFEKAGTAFVKTPHSLRGRIFDGITGAPMTMDQVDAERHVFSATMSTYVSVSSACAFIPVRIERLRVYPRTFVGTAARVLASTSILAADRFVARKPAGRAAGRV